MNIRAAAELTLAAAIWGFAFIAIVWVLPTIDPVSLNLIRFAIASVLGVLIIVLGKNRLSKAEHAQHFKLAAGPGLFLGLTLAFQTWGLETTSVTNSGFITTLYVVIVPIIEFVVMKKTLPRLHILWVAFALIGTMLMIGLHLEPAKIGDVLTLLCAFSASLQIVWIGKIHQKITSALLFNSYQCFWAALVTLGLIPIYGDLYFKSLAPNFIFGIFFLSVVSSLLAFTLQAQAQKSLSPSVASILFLMESPFAAVFAFFILGENFGPTKVLGGLLIFVAGAGAAVFGRTKTS